MHSKTLLISALSTMAVANTATVLAWDATKTLKFCVDSVIPNTVPCGVVASDALIARTDAEQVTIQTSPNQASEPKATPDAAVNEPLTSSLPQNVPEPMVTAAPMVSSKVLFAAPMPDNIVPVAVEESLLTDPNGPKSLAEQFSGKILPEWYKKLPKEVQELFMTGKGPWTTQPARDRESKARDRASSMSMLAESISVAAKHHSIAAKKSHDSADAYRASVASVTASSMSRAAASISKGLDHHKRPKNASTAVSAPDSALTFAVSITVAVVCLAFAVAL